MGSLSDPPTVDLVLATVGRVDDVARFFSSLEAQTFRDFRVIVVDQNEDDRLSAVLAPFEQTQNILRLRSQPGLSRARNVGLARLEGELVGFPDDDCCYPPDLLARVAGRFATGRACDGLAGISIGSDGHPTNMRWDRTAGSIDRWNVWRRAISYTIFLRRSLVEAVGGFAEELGPGSGTQWWATDETDYLLRALEAGFSLQFEPSLIIRHEDPETSFTQEAIRKAYAYGLSQGRTLRLHGYPWWFAAYRFAYLLAGASLFFVTARLGKGRFYLTMAVGRARGFLRPT